MKTLNRLRTQDNKFFDESFYVFDTETTPFEIGKTCAFIFGVVYGYGYQKVIYTKQEFIEEFKDPRYTKKKVFAHNAEFDLNVLYDNIYVMDNNAIFNGKFICATNKIPPGNEFGFGFKQSNGTIIEVGGKGTADIYAREIPVQYFDDRAIVQSGFINVRVW